MLGEVNNETKSSRANLFDCRKTRFIDLGLQAVNIQYNYLLQMFKLYLIQFLQLVFQSIQVAYKIYLQTKYFTE